MERKHRLDARVKTVNSKLTSGREGKNEKKMTYLKYLILIFFIKIIFSWLYKFLPFLKGDLKILCVNKLLSNINGLYFPKF